MTQLESKNTGYLHLINRRTFVLAGLALATVGSVNLIASSKVNAFKLLPNIEQTTEKLLRAMRDRHSAVQIGKAILNEPNAALPLQSRAHSLVTSIMNKLGLSYDALSSINTVDLTSRLNDRTVLDFDSGDMLSAAGWVLGRTEAQLCALAALAHTDVSVLHGALE